MQIGFLITARLKSTRLKKKILKPLNGYSVIEHVVRRAKEVKGCSNIVLCTSNISQDLPLIKIAKSNNINYFAGHPIDVLQRLLNAAQHFNIDYFIGITADNPLFSTHHANLIVQKFKVNNKLDYVFTSGLPLGVNIYGMKVKTLETVCKIKKETDTEIWGYLINRPEIFKVKELKVSKKYQFEKKKLRITLDELEDYKFFCKVFNSFPKNHIIDILEVYRLLKKKDYIININEHILQKDLEENVKRRISKFYKKNKEKILNIKKKIYFGT